ncbi:putative activity regulator of membrane protease YbbK [Pseudonocardia sp. Ae168_Ps1]|uniref:NfeD family protein n=1 Tax=unclassified Pseudonocardia TaxID=2619320 RepID=UPI00094AA391|nr:MULTISPECIES: NfeD family protein [unclassified Pseudonocardia]OLL72183.1 putative activity regulator of membrane protease YbbK [Pseudonocardia sp. Ae150A_Ps1]OLL78151.1 putative activity regulator of membrane protease YbbK [Pseudonocardia sp. Ae168_Ps1]OLL87726.1 putative activity regulator of membrane protease YbbK [Pseudonocardia sp. Ae263_Ps1]OLL92247.1 putative activity regulator of membrane protease YbbK [Pseudonocardia sp. Ae356_Ps1]
MTPALIWLLVGVVLVGAEFVSGELFLVMLGGGALAAAGGAALGLGLLPSAGLFAIVSVLLLLAVRPVAKRKLQERMGSLERHQDRFVGSAAEVVQRVDGEGGQVRIGKEVWSARAMDGREVLEAGTTVTVLQVTGAAVLVTGRGELPAS